MKVYVTTTVGDIWHIEAYYVIVAKNKKRAVKLLSKKFKELGLNSLVKKKDMIRIDTEKQHVYYKTEIIDV